MDRKRAVDIFGALTGLVVTAPFMAVAAVASAIEYRANPLLPVERLGKDKVPFQMYKLRTMTSDTDENGGLLPDEQRLTMVGKFLRATGIDEMPQFINVLKGDMSLIGPRPRSPGNERHEYVAPEYEDLFTVKPGLSGPWQVAVIGAKEQSPAEYRARMDAEYARSEPSLLNDFKLIYKSFASFTKGHDGGYIDWFAPEKKATDEPVNELT